jgi:hypothetical protein
MSYQRYGRAGDGRDGRRGDAGGHHLPTPGKQTLVQQLASAAPVQRRDGGGESGALEAGGESDVHAAAARGVATPSSQLPFLDTIQRAFGRHDVSNVRAHSGPDAAASAEAMGAEAYATGDHVVLGGGANLRTVAHEAAHVVQQRGGVQLKGGVGAAGDRYEQHADAVADLVVAGKSAEALLDEHAPDGGSRDGASSAGPVQRWLVPGETAQANKLLDRLDGIADSARTQRDRARDLSTVVPVSLRNPHWPSPYIVAYQDADNIRVSAEQAAALPQATTTLATLRNHVVQQGQALNTVKARLTAFENHYNGLKPQIDQQSARYGTIDQVMLEVNGAGKLGEWTQLALAIHGMNQVNMTNAVAAFTLRLDSGTFSETDVAAARLLGDGQRKRAVIQFLTELFTSGQLRLDTWSKSYPTAFDLRTGEFGAEWHLSCSSQRWLGQKWVFHAHCITTRDPDTNLHNGFMFKDILGTNHLKMTAERMAAGVQLDLPLPAATLTAMAATYQAEFQERLANDSTFRQTLKKAR